MNTVQSYENEAISDVNPSFGPIQWQLLPQLNSMVVDTVNQFYNEHLGIEDTDTWLTSCLTDLQEHLMYDDDDEGVKGKLQALTHTIHFVARLKALCDASDVIEQMLTE